MLQSQMKKKKNKETKKEIKKGEWKRMSNELFGSFFNIHEKHIPYFHTHMKYKKPKKMLQNQKKKKKNEEINQEMRMKANVQWTTSINF